jgi:5-methylcytosine-specific restriction endonuclease McrA
MPVNTRPGPAEAPCALCGRVRPLSFHHLIPRTLHRNKWFRKNFDAMDMRSRGIELCKECHEFIHQRYGQKSWEGG